MIANKEKILQVDEQGTTVGWYIRDPVLSMVEKTLHLFIQKMERRHIPLTMNELQHKVQQIELKLREEEPTTSNNESKYKFSRG